MAEEIVTEAYVTLVTSDSYTIGALVLGHSLRKTKTQKHLVVLLGKDVSGANRYRLEDVYDHTILVDEIDSGDAANLALLKRPELGITFTKLQAWSLTQYTKCVFLDADTIVVQNVDNLFEKESDFAAAPDVGWPDCFNSGVFVYTPSLETLQKLVELSEESGSFDGGDQGLLNSYFNTWPTSGAESRLSFTYNMTANASYGYVPAFKKFQDDIKIVHFTGAHKPWHGASFPAYGQQYSAVELVQKWWELHDDYLDCCSESASYKTTQGVRFARSPGPGEAMPPIPSPERLRSRSFGSDHDMARPVPRDPSQFNQSEGFSEIQARLDANIAAAAATSSRPAAKFNAAEEGGQDPTVKFDASEIPAEEFAQDPTRKI